MKRWMVGLVIVVLVGMGIWWGWFHQPYQPKAYVGIVKWDVVEQKYRENFRSHIIEMDLSTVSVTDTFPVSDSVPLVNSIDVDADRKLLYVGGYYGAEAGPKDFRGSKGIDVYDLTTNQKVRTVEITGPNPVDNMRVSPSGQRLITKNPLRYTESGERGKQSAVYDLPTGKFVHGFDQGVTAISYIFNNGNNYIEFYGSDLNEFFIFHYSTKKDRKLEHESELDKIKERGGLHPDPENGDTIPYPYYTNTDEWKPLKVFDRDTLQLIDTGPVVMQGLEEQALETAGGAPPKMLTKNHRYLAVQFVRGMNQPPEGVAQYFVRVVDLKNMKIVGTTKVWEGNTEQANYTSVVAY